MSMPDVLLEVYPCISCMMYLLTEIEGCLTLTGEVIIRGARAGHNAPRPPYRVFASDNGRKMHIIQKKYSSGSSLCISSPLIALGSWKIRLN